MQQFSRSLVAFWMVLVLTGSLEGQTSSPAFYAFLRAESGTRGAALGGAAVALTENIEDSFYNPAILSTVPQKAAQFTFEKHLLDINAGLIAAAFPVQELFSAVSGIASVGAQYVDYGTFERSDVTGNPLGSFRASHLALHLRYSNEVDTLFYYGVGLKFIASTLEQYAATAIAADVGLLYLVPEHRTTVGLAIQNVGMQLSATGTVEESLPIDVRIGLSHKPRGLPLLLNIALVQLADSYQKFSDLFDRIAIGGEWYFGKVVRLRIGYNQFRRTNMRLERRSGWSGFSGGLGIQWDQYRIDYAVLAFGVQSFVHRLGVGIQW